MTFPLVNTFNGSVQYGRLKLGGEEKLMSFCISA